MTPPRLLITDLDNTLFDWIGHFAKSFDAMLSALCLRTGATRRQLQAEFKSVHQRHGNSEQPFAVLETPSVIRACGSTARDALAKFADDAFRLYDETRLRTLSLYDGVREGLSRLTALGIPVVGHMESISVNAVRRLVGLGIRDHFQHLYCLKPLEVGDGGGRAKTVGPPDFVREVPRADRKPSPSVILDVCAQQRVSPSECVYVGDSIARDVLMARRAGAIAVWARYGTNHDRGHWDDLVAVTHWTDEDVRREVELHAQAASVRPDLTVDRFDEVCALFDRESAPAQLVP